MSDLNIRLCSEEVLARARKRLPPAAVDPLSAVRYTETVGRKPTPTCRSRQPFPFITNEPYAMKAHIVSEQTACAFFRRGGTMTLEEFFPRPSRSGHRFFRRRRFGLSALRRHALRQARPRLHRPLTISATLRAGRRAPSGGRARRCPQRAPAGCARCARRSRKRTGSLLSLQAGRAHNDPRCRCRRRLHAALRRHQRF